VSFDLHALEQYYPQLLQGLLLTIVAVLVILPAGLAIGLIACALRLRQRGFARTLAGWFITFFRTVPEIVLIFWVYTCLPLLLEIRLSAWACGVIALSLYAGAYLAEIFRAGVLSLPAGQWEAGRALGIRGYHLWRRIILPQAVRRFLPAFVGFTTELVKGTGLLSAIGIAELVYQASVLGSLTFRYVEFFSGAAVLYFLILFPISLVARALEGRKTM
jgi:His/Glu/Gln/Arg/opine family amino acid ABC transporter permease subunit